MEKRIVITGAAGGIGRETAILLAQHGHDLTLVDRDADGLADTQVALGTPARTLVVDLADPKDRAQLCEALAGEVPDVLVNNAGILNFAPLDRLPLEQIEAEFRVNVLAPIALSQAVLPGMRNRGDGHIVNVGSMFGSIGFAYFATYSSTKFAIRGFSQALRREVAGSGIRVSYVAPRATRTGLATQFGKMAEKVGMRMDPPTRVAAAITDVVKRGDCERYVGFPESFFVRVNALFPRVVDAALRKQDLQARPFAEEAIGEQQKRRAPGWAA